MKTPRTEMALIDNSELCDMGFGKSNLVSADFARQLETELTQLREMAEEMEKSVKRLLPYVPKGNFMPSADIADTITKFNQLKGQAK